ncbi:MAG: Flp family type IVb pilin, partial [Alphaproteobacteria bacterium]
MRDLVQLLENDESGATAIEYGLIAAVASLAIIGGTSAMGVSLSSYFEWVSAEIQR